MATSSAFQLDRFLKKVTGVFTENTSPARAREVAVEAIRIIVRRARLGYGASGGQRVAFPERRPNYNIFRKINKTNLDESTKPTKKNVTFSGQLLRSMSVLAIRAMGYSFTASIGPQGKRNPVLVNAVRGLKEGKPKAGAQFYQKTSLSNDQVYGRLLKINPAYKFNAMTEPEERQLLRFYRRTFADLIRVRFKKF